MNSSKILSIIYKVIIKTISSLLHITSFHLVLKILVELFFPQKKRKLKILNNFNIKKSSKPPWHTLSENE